MTINLILLSLLAYVIGSIPSGLWIGKIFYKKIFASSVAVT